MKIQLNTHHVDMVKATHCVPSTVGRSMGARAASALARQLSGRPEDAVAGLVCLSFPLHPPGQTHTHRQRSEDLRGLPKEVPVLFLSGTADNMCEKVRMALGVFWTLHKGQQIGVLCSDRNR